jgi:hypothetical protein
MKRDKAVRWAALILAVLATSALVSFYTARWEVRRAQHQREVAVWAEDKPGAADGISNEAWFKDYTSVLNQRAPERPRRAPGSKRAQAERAPHR